MEAFVNTAYRYLKGESELPSLLPSKESADMAKEKSRKVRLFCKGLECFCEILYRETVAEEQHVDPKVAHNDAVMVADEELIEAPMGQDQTMMTAEEGHPETAVLQNDATPSVIDTFSEQLVNCNAEYDDTAMVAGEEQLVDPHVELNDATQKNHSKSAVQQNDAIPSVIETDTENKVEKNLDDTAD